MRVFSRSVFLSLFVVAIAAGAGAAEPFIAIADVATGRALVPEGSVIPSGVRFFVGKQGVRVEDKTDAAPRERVPLVFAYAPASRFVEARKVIEKARAAAAPPVMRYVRVPSTEGGEATENGLRVITHDDPQWIYLYFDYGNYTSALRHVYSSGGYTSYGSGTEAYSAPATPNYYTVTVSVSLSSNLVWGPSGGPYFDPYGYSNACTYGPSGGGCGTSYPYVGGAGFTGATVESYGEVYQRFGSCWNPNSPCLRFYNGTIQITFP